MPTIPWRSVNNATRRWDCGPIREWCVDLHLQSCCLLSASPQIGKLLDETGQIASGKLILSDLAWNQILDMTPAILVSSSTDTLKSLEQRLLYTRITLVFGWSEEVGKLAVARVMR